MIEIDITKLERGTKNEWKTVTRDGKTNADFDKYLAHLRYPDDGLTK